MTTSAPGEFFPGLLYVDMLQVLGAKPEGIGQAVSQLRELGFGKPVGVTFSAASASSPSTAKLPEGVAWMLVDSPR